MARTGPDNCLFCGEVPCICGKPTRKVTSGKKAERKKLSQPAKNASKAERTSAATAAMKQVVQASEESDEIWQPALQVLSAAGLLHPSELHRVSQPEPVRRAEAWRNRRLK